jgi:hypothetical protein
MKKRTFELPHFAAPPQKNFPDYGHQAASTPPFASGSNDIPICALDDEQHRLELAYVAPPWRAASAFLTKAIPIMAARVDDDAWIIERIREPTEMG